MLYLLVNYTLQRSFLRAFACVRLRACLRAELIKTRLLAKYFNTQTHFGFRNFQDVLYIHIHYTVTESKSIINPLRMCEARVTVVVRCVCVCS